MLMSTGLDKISKFYTQVLLESPKAQEARDYLLSRGFTEETLREFGVGFSPNARIDYIKHGYLTYSEVDFLINIQHLFRQSSNLCSDRFSGRVLFPVKKPNGQVSGFAARTITDELPKYLNSAESSVYKKAHVLFGLDLAKDHIYDSDRAIICEGYTDAMAFYQSGIKIAVAAGGTHATSHQLAQIARYTQNIYLAFDSDAAGDAVTQNTYRLIKEMGLNAGKIDIPRGKDPAEVLLNR